MKRVSLESKITKVVAEHYGVHDFVIERAGALNLLRMSALARKVAINESDKQLVKIRQGKRIAREQRAKRFADSECAA